MNIIERYKKPTPKFFRILRNIGVALATIGGTVISLSIYLPSILVTLGAYLTIAGTVASAISQAAVINEVPTNKSKKNEHH